jgi:hypothetical protein
MDIGVDQARRAGGSGGGREASGRGQGDTGGAEEQTSVHVDLENNGIEVPQRNVIPSATAAA